MSILFYSGFDIEKTYYYYQLYIHLMQKKIMSLIKHVSQIQFHFLLSLNIK